MIDTQTKNIYKVCKWDVMYFKQLTMKFNNFVASCNIYCVVYRPICRHRSRCHADNRHHQQTHVTAPGVARRGSSEYTWKMT